jgi:hypothetical protein
VVCFPGDADILSIYADAELVATRAGWWIGAPVSLLVTSASWPVF